MARTHAEAAVAAQRKHGMVRKVLSGAVARGRFADLGLDGTLVLETVSGRMVSHSAGELFFG